MKKIQLLLSFCFAFAMLSSKTFAQLPSIDSVQILPANPTDGDSVKLVYYTTFATGPCSLDTFIYSQQDTSIYIMLNYAVGDFTAICHSVDTINLGLFQSGNYFATSALTIGLLQAIFDMDSTSFAITKTLSVSDNFNQGKSIVLYPNPVTDIVHIKNLESSTMLRVYNIVGQVIYQAQFKANENNVIETHNWSPSLYWFEMTDEKGNKLVKRITKVR